MIAIPPRPPTLDPVSDILRTDRQPLAALFNPTSVALIGATDREGSVGRTILWNLMSSPFGGAIYPVNPKRPHVLGIPAYASLSQIPGPVDLAVIVTPAPTVPDLVGECVDRGVKAAIVISAGFRETGAAGRALEDQIQAHLRRGTLRLIGPNCLGVMNPLTGLNATFATTLARPGQVAFISQSGALCTSVLDWSLQDNVGFSAFMSIGSMLDVGWGDLIDYFGDDPHTRSIVLYMESIGDARAFLSAAREVALTKPIIVIKAGRTAAAAQAATSHSGALAGRDEVLDAAFRRCGVLRVNQIAELFDMAEVLAKQTVRPRGPHLTIITNAGGPGVLATDALIAAGGQLATLAPDTLEALNRVLPAHWSHGNPIDILGDADPERYAQALQVVLQDAHSDGVLVVLTPQAMTNPRQIATELASQASSAGRPVLASWMGGEGVQAGIDCLNQASIPTYAFPDEAARVFSLMWHYSDALHSLYETPTLVDGSPMREQVAGMLAAVHREGRTLLTEVEAKAVLAAYQIPVVPTGIARSPHEAVTLATDMGFPVVLKLWSETLTHKTDVGGVLLNLEDGAAVARAYTTIERNVTAAAGREHFLGVTVQPMIRLSDGYELILGSSPDPQFGPVLLFGAGGQLVEVFRDTAVALPPLNTTLARRLMEQTHIDQALRGVRGRDPVDREAVAELLVRFSQLVVEQPWIAELDINPLLASPQGLMALDARIVLHPPETPVASLPRPAIRPYPTQYVQPWTLRDGTEVTIRPIRPEDEPLLVAFHGLLSEESVYLRYFHLIKFSQRVAHERLTRLCFIDYDREMALVVERPAASGTPPQILAVGRLSRHPGRPAGEFALLVADPWQCQGLGTELLRQLVAIGRQEGLQQITAELLPENRGMQRVCQKLDFHLHPDPDAGVLHAHYNLA